MTRRTSAPAALACGLLLAFAGPASAATTIGQTFTPNATSTNTVLQTGVASGQGYTVPSDGVIVSWGSQAGSGDSTAKLKVARQVDASNWTIVGDSEYGTIPAGQSQSFATRVPVKAGDVIGAQASSGSTLAFTGQAGDTFISTSGDQPAGTTAPYTSANSIKVDVAASIEPDADGDGYGDETQDKCPTDPSLQVACAADVSITESVDHGSYYPGQDVGFTIEVANHGPSRANTTKIVGELSPELSFVAADPSSGTCSADPPHISCDLGDLEKDGTVRVRLVARAVVVGTASAAVKGAATTGDPYLGNNGGGAATQIAWRPGACANLFTPPPYSIKRVVLKGTTAGDRLVGGPGNDVLSGLDGPDCLSGGAGNDRLSGNGGNDRIDGGAGNDRITGGSGADRVTGGTGNDRINVNDGHRDQVDCGPGRDRVTADRRDKLRRCEVVVRPRKTRKTAPH